MLVTEVNDFAARLKWAVRESGKPAADVYRRLKVSKATWYTWTGDRASVPEPATCFALADELGIEPRWLITGKGPRIEPVQRFTQEQIDLAEAWPSLPPATQQAIASLIRAAVVDMAPSLKAPLSKTNRELQERANRLLEEAQRNAQK